MTYDNLLLKMRYCKDVIEAFEDSIVEGDGNAVAIAFKFGEWKSTLTKAIRELEVEILEAQKKK